jgi:hypothetical protein
MLQMHRSGLPKLHGTVLHCRLHDGQFRKSRNRLRFGESSKFGRESLPLRSRVRQIGRARQEHLRERPERDQSRTQQQEVLHGRDVQDFLRRRNVGPHRQSQQLPAARHFAGQGAVLRRVPAQTRLRRHQTRMLRIPVSCFYIEKNLNFIKKLK